MDLRTKSPQFLAERNYGAGPFRERGAGKGTWQIVVDGLVSTSCW